MSRLGFKNINEKKFRGYIFSRPFHDERVPQNVQNLVIREFVKKNFDYLLSKAEYSMKNFTVCSNPL